MMKKKPLMTLCICAVVLLVIASLSNVVGYQSVKSTAVNDSPLFQTMTQRATSQEQNLITSHYLGRGKQSNLHFPVRDNTTEQIKKAAELIGNMDDATFARFTNLCIQQAWQDSTLSKLHSNEILLALRLLRTNPEMIINAYTERNTQNFTVSEARTVCNWVPGCLLLFSYWFVIFIFTIVLFIVGVILFILLYLIIAPSSRTPCYPP
jgi:hypothetical protein